MTTIETIRKDLHQLINQVDDIGLLKKVRQYIKVLKKEQSRRHILSAMEREMIDLGIQQLADNKGIPHEVVQLSIQEILR